MEEPALDDHPLQRGRRNADAGSDDLIDKQSVVDHEIIVANSLHRITSDMFWNYKSCEFFMDALFSIMVTYEHYGDGLGSFIVSKILLPIFHGLKHSNYSSSIHRFISRVLCVATPKKGMKIIHERFSNRKGKPGCNIHRDKRMEYRIGTLKTLIRRLGSNFSKEAVQHVNATVDIKEELFLIMREAHGVPIRSGKHKTRDD